MYTQQVYNEAISKGMPPILASLIVAQSQHESGNYTSNIFNNCRNSFGYGAVSNPCSYNGTFESYPSIIQSTDDVVNWIYRRQAAGNFPVDLGTITTPAQYAQLLHDNGYYTDSVANYTAGLTNYFNPSLNGSNGSFVGIAAIIAAVGIYLLVIKKK